MKLFISPCPNDTFAFEAIINKRIDLEGMQFEVEYYDIEELNERAIKLEAAITKVSCAVIPQISKRYALSNVGAAIGRGNGPLLVRRAGDKNPIRNVAIPGLNTTANMLMKRLFPDISESQRKPILFSDIAQAIQSGKSADGSITDIDAGVLIHEGRFLYQEQGLELVADLGQLWEQQRGLPLPLGAIMLRRDLTTREQQNFQRILRKSIEYAMANPKISRPFIKEHAQEMDDKVIDAHIALFVNNFTLELGVEGKSAIKEFTAQ